MDVVLALVLSALMANASAVRSPFAVAETAPGSACIISEQKLEPGQPVVIVLFAPERFITGTVMGPLSQPCRRGSDAAGTTYSITPPRNVDLDFGIGIAVMSEGASASLEKGHVVVRNVRKRGDAVGFRSCASSEGLHLTAWQGKARVWHEYYYLRYETEPTCTDEETGDAPARN